jgi:hypothetical protein
MCAPLLHKSIAQTFKKRIIGFITKFYIKVQCFIKVSPNKMSYLISYSLWLNEVFKQPRIHIFYRVEACQGWISILRKSREEIVFVISILRKSREEIVFVIWLGWQSCMWKSTFTSQNWYCTQSTLQMLKFFAGLYLS